MFVFQVFYIRDIFFAYTRACALRKTFLISGFKSISGLARATVRKFMSAVSRLARAVLELETLGGDAASTLYNLENCSNNATTRASCRIEGLLLANSCNCLNNLKLRSEATLLGGAKGAFRGTMGGAEGIMGGAEGIMGGAKGAIGGAEGAMGVGVKVGYLVLS